MTSRPRRPRLTAREPWLAFVVAIGLCAACGDGLTSTATFGPTSALPTLDPGASLPPGVSPGPSIAGATAPPGTPAPAPTGVLTKGFKYGDILKSKVNSLAARVAPKRTAALVHGYNLSGPAPIDDGLVRLNKGEYVSVHLGPLKIGNTVWYLVWPSDDAKFHQSAVDWYSGPPATTAAGPAWVAASVGSDVYLAFDRSPSVEQLEGFLPIGVNLAGSGPWVSAPQPRHDFHLFDWAAAASPQGTSCTLEVKLVPADPTWAPKVAVSTSTDTSKVSPLDGDAVGAPWLPIPDGQWTTFTVQVSGTCRWAIRLTALHHD